MKRIFVIILLLLLTSVATAQVITKLTDTGGRAINPATSDNQTNGNQKTQVTSMPSVTTTSVRKVMDTNNTTDVALAANATFTGTWTETSNFIQAITELLVDQPSAISGFKFQLSRDGITLDHEHDFSPVSNLPDGHHYPCTLDNKYFRVVYTNGTTTQGTFKLITSLLTNAAEDGHVHPINYSIDSDHPAPIRRSVIVGQTTGGGGGYVNVKVNPSGALTVDATGSAVTTSTSSITPISSAQEASILANQTNGTQSSKTLYAYGTAITGTAITSLTTGSVIYTGDISGYSTVNIQFYGTYSGLGFSMLGSMDNVRWGTSTASGIPGRSAISPLTTNHFTPVDSSTGMIIFPAQGFKYLKLMADAYSSGTFSVDMYPSTANWNTYQMVIVSGASGSLPALSPGTNNIGSVNALFTNQSSSVPVSIVSQSTWTSCIQSGVTTTTQCLSVPTSGQRNWITSYSLANASTGTNIVNLVYGTGTNCGTGFSNLTVPTYLTPTTLAGNSMAFSFSSPIPAPINQAVCCKTASGLAFGCMINGYTGP